MNFEQLATVRAARIALAASAAAHAELSRDFNRSSKDPLVAATEAYNAHLKETTGGKAGQVVYLAIANAPGDATSEYCATAKGTWKAEKGFTTVYFGFWDSQESVSLDRVLRYLTEDEYNKLWQVESDAYDAEQAKLAKEAEEAAAAKEAEKQAAKDAREKVKADAKAAALAAKSGGAPAGEGTGGDGSGEEGKKDEAAAGANQQPADAVDSAVAAGTAKDTPAKGKGTTPPPVPGKPAAAAAAAE